MYYLGGKSIEHRNYLPKASVERNLKVSVKLTSWSVIFKCTQKGRQVITTYCCVTVTARCSLDMIRG